MELETGPYNVFTVYFHCLHFYAAHLTLHQPLPSEKVAFPSKSKVTKGVKTYVTTWRTELSKHWGRPSGAGCQEMGLGPGQ